jgi:hypothetical protein
MNGVNILAKKLKTPHPSRLRLRLLALEIRLNNLSPSQRLSLASAIEKIGDGETFEVAFGIARSSGRPVNPMMETWAFEVAVNMLPTNRGGQNLKVTKAIEQVAVAHKKSTDAIRKAVKACPHVKQWTETNYYSALDWINRP